MPANLCVATVIVTWFSPGVSHLLLLPPRPCSISHCSFLSFFLISNLCVFTVSFPLAVKCSVSPMFTFLVPTNKLPTSQIQQICHSPPFSGAPCCVQCSLSTLFSGRVFGFWDKVHASVFLLPLCLISPWWASLPLPSCYCWRLMLVVLLFSF